LETRERYSSVTYTLPRGYEHVPDSVMDDDDDKTEGKPLEHSSRAKN
jgi:hypothetical protein